MLATQPIFGPEMHSTHPARPLATSSTESRGRQVIEVVVMGGGAYLLNKYSVQCGLLTDWMGT